MHHLAFFEAQAKRDNDKKQELLLQSCKAFMSSSNKSNGVQMNGECEMLKEKPITDDMPKWKQEQARKYNEKVQQMNEEIIARKKSEEEAEKQKWEGMPAWKAAIIRKREEDQRRKEEEERQAKLKEQEEKARWENLPVWKRGIYEKKGFKPVNKPPELINQSATDSQVAREESTPDNAPSEDVAEQDDCGSQDNKLDLEEYNSESEHDGNETEQEQKDEDNNNSNDDNNDDENVNNTADDDNDNDEVIVQEQQEVQLESPIDQDTAVDEDKNEDKDGDDDDANKVAQKENGEVESNEQPDDSAVSEKISQNVEQEALLNGLTAV